jgi:hypothetical protein
MRFALRQHVRKGGAAAPEGAPLVHTVLLAAGDAVLGLRGARGISGIVLGESEDEHDGRAALVITSLEPGGPAAQLSCLVPGLELHGIGAVGVAAGCSAEDACLAIDAALRAAGAAGAELHWTSSPSAAEAQLRLGQVRDDYDVMWAVHASVFFPLPECLRGCTTSGQCYDLGCGLAHSEARAAVCYRLAAAQV